MGRRAPAPREVGYVGIVSQQKQPEAGQAGQAGQAGRGHRPPRFSAFLMTGALLGLLAGFVLSAIGPVNARYDTWTVWAFLGLVCAALGLLLGGVVAVLVDRRS